MAASCITAVSSFPPCPMSHTVPASNPSRTSPRAADDEPWKVADPRVVSEALPEGCPHAFQPPREADSRSPCPALNTLANHGYLPRDGRNITREDLMAALRNPNTYHLSKPLAQVLVYGGFLMMHELKAPSISLHELARHGFIEHNASIVHKDTATGRPFAPTRCDTKLLDDFLDGDVLTLEMVQKRRVELEEVSTLDAVHQEIARGEWALVLDIFGREHGGKIPCDFLRVWLKKNQFPEGWRPTHEQGLLATALKSREIRLGMEKYRTEFDESPEDSCSELKLVGELRSTSPTSMVGDEWESKHLPLEVRA